MIVFHGAPGGDRSKGFNSDAFGKGHLTLPSRCLQLRGDDRWRFERQSPPIAVVLNKATAPGGDGN